MKLCPSWRPVKELRCLCKFRSFASNTTNKLEFSPEYVLSDKSKGRCIARFQRMPSIRMKEGEIPAKQAAVLVPLCISNGNIALLYTLRSRAMSKNAGQISFPGGMRDDTDGDLVETAIREAHEELGIDKKMVDVWCMGKFIGTWDRSMGVMPVVGFVGEIKVEKLQINPKEVDEVFCVPLQWYCDPKNTGYTKFLKGYSLPVFTYNGYQIWGLTAMITHVLLSALLQEKYTKHASKLFRFFTRVG